MHEEDDGWKLKARILMCGLLFVNRRYDYNDMIGTLRTVFHQDAASIQRLVDNLVNRELLWRDAESLQLPESFGELHATCEVIMRLLRTTETVNFPELLDGVMTSIDVTFEQVTVALNYLCQQRRVKYESISQRVIPL